MIPKQFYRFHYLDTAKIIVSLNYKATNYASLSDLILLHTEANKRKHLHGAVCNDFCIIFSAMMGYFHVTG